MNFILLIAAGNMNDEPLNLIMLVEDSEADIELTLLALESAGVRNPFIVVRDGEEALDYLFCRGKWNGRDDEHPALILLDKKLPKVDGHEVLEAIREDGALRHIPIVMLTSSREERDLLRSYDLGVNGYVVKPVQFGDFMDAIRDIGDYWMDLDENAPRT